MPLRYPSFWIPPRNWAVRPAGAVPSYQALKEPLKVWIQSRSAAEFPLATT